MPLIVGNKLTKTYMMDMVRVEALQGMDILVEKGEFLAIMGPSGSGKSTLMHLLGCLDRPTSGQLYIDGAEVSLLSDRELAQLRNKKIGFVFQTFHLLPRFTALENVELPMLYARTPKIERKKRAEALLKQVGLSHRIHHRPNELSGGERQRVAIARALANQPDLILADEPTGNLDSRAGEEIMATLQQLNKEGVTLVLVTHDSYIASHARRILHIRDGVLLREEILHAS